MPNVFNSELVSYLIAFPTKPIGKEVVRMDLDVERVKDLIAKREEIDVELASLFGGKQAPRRALKCSLCNSEGHTARTCPTRLSEGQ